MFTENYIRENHNAHDMVIVYDGDCPLCRNYMVFSKLKEHGNVALVDARKIPAAPLANIMEEYDLDDGMLFYRDNRLYFGHEALHEISLLSTNNNWFNKLMRPILSNAKQARIIYPFLVKGRLLLLALLGHGKIAKS